eukprot:COSAG04_NODE_2935_length_3372_cov_5.637857_3_plen_181_part_00
MLAEAPWEGRHTAGYAEFAGRMWIVGGDVQQGHYQSDVWSSADGVEWDCAGHHPCPALPSAGHHLLPAEPSLRPSGHTLDAPWGPRCLHIALAFDGYLWVLGGQTSYEPEVTEPAGVEDAYFSDVWRSSNGERWDKVLDDAPWGPRGMVGGRAVKDGKMWLIGENRLEPSLIFKKGAPLR